MNPDHYAVIIALSAYPRWDPPASLRGPDNDAEAVFEWLAGPGGVPKDNIKRISSRDFGAPPAAAPTRDNLDEAAFMWLDEIARKNRQRTGRRSVGERLYFYASGHGFSPSSGQGCLLTGNASEDSVTTNIWPSGWIQWFQDAQYFQEYVLWMDCCMDRTAFALPTPPPLARIGGAAPSAANFLAFAAKRALETVENAIPEDGDKYHGVFTWNLLQGLRGAAVDGAGQVTAASLAAWLRQAQLPRLDERQRLNVVIAKEPDIVEGSGGLVFADNVVPMEFDVTLLMPKNAAGARARLWAGSPPEIQQVFDVLPGGNPLRLRPGLYLAEVSQTGLRHGFAVTRAGGIELSETGPEPVASRSLCKVEISSDNPADYLSLVQHDFRLVKSCGGVLSARLQSGLYQLRVFTRRQIVERVFLFDHDQSIPHAAAQPMTAAAPLLEAEAPHEHHIMEMAEIMGEGSRINGATGAGARLLISARWRGDGEQPDIYVSDGAGKTLASLPARRPGAEASTCTADVSLDVSPGGYELHFPAGAIPSAQSLYAPPDWILEAHIDYEATASPRLSYVMRGRRSLVDATADPILEKARLALADEQCILNDELAQLLLFKFDNPLAGIIGGHLLLIELGCAENPSRPRKRLDGVVARLRELVGREHPDVEALSLACPDSSLRRRDPVLSPPLFERSWRMLENASYDTPQLIPRELWRRVYARASAPPFLRWATDGKVQRSVLESLAAQRDYVRKSAGAFAFETNREMGVSGNFEGLDALRLPPAALDVLESEFPSRT